MRSVAQHVSALPQSIKNERHIHLLEITHPTMHQLRAAARGSFGEVIALHEHRAESTRHRFNRSTETRRAAADHQHIPRLSLLAQLAQKLIASGQPSASASFVQPSARPKALRQEARTLPLAAASITGLKTRSICRS